MNQAPSAPAPASAPQARPYVPDRGDLVWLDFSPQVGHEQAGRRAALVLTTQEYNRKSGLAVVCPMTGEQKQYPYEAVLGAESIALVDQVKSVDWHGRNCERMGKVTAAAIQRVSLLLRALLP